MFCVYVCVDEEDEEEEEREPEEQEEEEEDNQPIHDRCHFLAQAWYVA